MSFREFRQFGVGQAKEASMLDTADLNASRRAAADAAVKAPAAMPAGKASMSRGKKGAIGAGVATLLAAGAFGAKKYNDSKKVDGGQQKAASEEC